MSDQQYQTGESVTYLGERYTVEGYDQKCNIIIRKFGMMFPKVLPPHHVHRPEPTTAVNPFICKHRGNAWMFDRGN